MKKIIAALAALISVFAFTAPAQAATPADYSDVRYMLSIMKDTWDEMDFDTRFTICDFYYETPKFARDMMAETFNDPYDGAFSEYSLYDVKRATWRLLRWAC